MNKIPLLQILLQRKKKYKGKKFLFVTKNVTREKNLFVTNYVTREKNSFVW